METAFAWIGQLMEWLATWIPRIAHVDARCRGVRFVGGREGRLVKPGITVYWPIVTNLIVWPVVTQTLKLRSQSLRTADHHTVELEILVTYRISDLVALFAELHDPESGVADLCLGAARQVVCCSTLQALENDARRTDEALEKEIQKQVRALGIDIRRARFVSLVPVRPLKHFGMPTPTEHDGAQHT